MSASSFNESGALDAEAFLSLLTRHEPEIMGFIWSISYSGEDAEEIFQNAAVVMLEKRSSYEPGSNFVAWACQIAKFSAYELNRSRKRRLLFDNDVIEQLVSTAGEESNEFVLMRRRALSSCLAKLCDDDRELIQECYCGGKRIKKVAEEMNLPTRGVYRSLGRIRKVLYRCMQATLSREAI